MSGLLLVSLAGLTVLLAGWWVSRPIPLIWRWMFRLALLAMVTGLMLPSSAIEWLRDALAVFLPLAREVSDAPASSYVGHFLLFVSVSGLLFWHRRDLPLPWLVATMASLAFITEGIQLLADGRYASWSDVAVNLFGVTIGLALRLALIHQNARRSG